MTKSSARREQLTSRPAERQRFILDHLRANGLADTLDRDFVVAYIQATDVPSRGACQPRRRAAHHRGVTSATNWPAPSAPWATAADLEAILNGIEPEPEEENEEDEGDGGRARSTGELLSTIDVTVDDPKQDR